MVIADGATLHVGAVVVGKPLTVTGQGAGPLPANLLLPKGAILATAAAAGWTGNITATESNANNTGFTTALSIGANSGDTLTIDGTITGTGNTTNYLKVGAGTVTLVGAVSLGAGNLTIGTGNLVLQNSDTSPAPRRSTRAAI